MNRRNMFKFFGAAAALAAAPAATGVVMLSKPAPRPIYRTDGDGRVGKGSPLTYEELDRNFYSLDQRISNIGG
jgi:hypothetical protein